MMRCLAILGFAVLAESDSMASLPASLASWEHQGEPAPVAMGAAASLAGAEIEKPKDGSDLVDFDTAKAEVVRLRAKIAEAAAASAAEPVRVGLAFQPAANPTPFPTFHDAAQAFQVNKINELADQGLVDPQDAIVQQALQQQRDQQALELQKEHNKLEPVNLCEIFQGEISYGACAQEIQEEGSKLCDETWVGHCGVSRKPPGGFGVESTYLEMCPDHCLEHTLFSEYDAHLAAAGLVSRLGRPPGERDTVVASEKGLKTHGNDIASDRDRSSWLFRIIASAVVVGAVLVGVVLNGYGRSLRENQNRNQLHRSEGQTRVGLNEATSTSANPAWGGAHEGGGARHQQHCSSSLVPNVAVAAL
jgi:hypothetical protein